MQPGLIQTQSVPCGVLLVGLDERIIEANERMARMLGRDPASLCGVSWLTLMPRAASLMHHTYMSPLLSQHGCVEEVSLPWLAADGSTVDTLVNASRTTWRGEAVTCLAVFHLRERRQLEEQLLHAKRAAEQVPGLLSLLRRTRDLHWQLLYASEAVRDLFGLSPLQVVNSPGLIWQMVHPDDMAPIQEALRRSVDQLTPLRVEFRILREGQEQWRETHATPQRESDGSILWHGYTSDITERKAIEAATRDRLAAERASQAKSSFLARVSHELRTPLNGILGFSKLMIIDDRHPLCADHLRKVGYIEEAGQSLLRLINEVMDISRIETGQVALNLGVLSLPEVVQEAVRMVEPMAAQRGVQVRVEGKVRPQVLADAHRLTQILINLLSNAIKYGPEGGRVTVTVGHAGANHACVGVADEGPGLSVAQQAQLFQPFNRLGAERSNVEGTGLGLIIAKGLAELMAGSLELVSEPGRGCHFAVHLPQAQPAAQTGPATCGGVSAAPPGLGLPGDGVGAQRRVLYVEDNAVNWALMESILALRPAIQLVRAASGAEALELVKEVRPDLMLVDIHLPDTDGVNLLKSLRLQRPDLNQVSAVAVSSDALSGDVASALAQGFAAYWTKPLDVVQVLSLLDGLLPDLGAAGGTMSA